MTNKRYFLLAGILAFIGLAGVSCSVNGEDYPIVTLTPAPVTQTPVTTQQPTDIPTQTPYPTFAPFPNLSSSTPIPYPTASVVKANAVAFIERDREGKLFLWVANVDGSGETKLVDIIQKDSQINILMQWSPNREWISYRSENDLWAVSRDGSVKRKLISFPDKNIGQLYVYAWSPDSSQIAYVETHPSKEGGPGPITVGLLDLATDTVSEISSHKLAGDPMPISWSPDGRYLVFAKDFSYVAYEIATRKVVQEINSQYGCWIGWHTWSPNSKWFTHTHSGTGAPWTCVSGLDGSNREIHINGAIFLSAWDKTGNILYLAAQTNNMRNEPNIDTDHELLRYDVRKQETKILFSFREKASPYQYMWTISISPDGNTLEMDSTNSEKQQSYIFVDLESMNIRRFEVSNIPDDRHAFSSNTYWSADNRNMIFLSESNGCFYKLDVQTGKTTIISGKHSVESWAVSPIATSP